MSVGLDPMVAVMSNIRVIDGYHNIYPLSYKVKFRKIIENPWKSSISWSQELWTNFSDLWISPFIEAPFQICTGIHRVGNRVFSASTPLLSIFPAFHKTEFDNFARGWIGATLKFVKFRKIFEKKRIFIWKNEPLKFHHKITGRPSQNASKTFGNRLEIFLWYLEPA